MDPQYCAQDVLRCDQCDATSVSKFCKLCQAKLCTDCEGKNCQEKSHTHQVLPYPQRHSITQNPPCANHAGKQCQLNCITCGVPVCSTCMYSKEHSGHSFSEIRHEEGHGINTETTIQPLDSPFKLSLSSQPGVHGLITEASQEASAISPRVIQFLDKPQLLYTMRTDIAGLSCVACFRDDEVWACGRENLIRRHSIRNREGSFLTTKCKNSPCGLTVTKSGHLVFTDVDERTINIVKKKNKIEKLVKLKKWLPRYVCSTSDDDLLVMMDHADYNSEPTRVVRYTGSKEKQIVQVDDRGQPLYSIGGYSRYIAENGNRDICVSDNGYDFQCVTVVNQAGRFRFRYRGNPILDKKSFLPKGIATDSHNQILVVCINNVSIHVIDKDGQFLRYISDYDLCDPMGLCVDSKDNLLVTEYRSTKVKKIQYIKS